MSLSPIKSQTLAKVRLSLPSTAPSKISSSQALSRLLGLVYTVHLVRNPMGVISSRLRLSQFCGGNDDEFVENHPGGANHHNLLKHSTNQSVRFDEMENQDLKTRVCSRDVCNSMMHTLGMLQQKSTPPSIRVQKNYYLLKYENIVRSPVKEMNLLLGNISLFFSINNIPHSFTSTSFHHHQHRPALTPLTLDYDTASWLASTTTAASEDGPWQLRRNAIKTANEWQHHLSQKDIDIAHRLELKYNQLSTPPPLPFFFFNVAVLSCFWTLTFTIIPNLI
jgi:hypothetical protein